MKEKKERMENKRQEGKRKDYYRTSSQTRYLS